MNALCGEKGSGGERGKAHPVTRKAAVAGEGRGLPGGRWAGAGCGHPVWALPGTWRLRPRAPAVTSAGPTETPHAAAAGPGQTGGRGGGPSEALASPLGTSLSPVYESSLPRPPPRPPHPKPCPGSISGRGRGHRLPQSQVPASQLSGHRDWQQDDVMTSDPSAGSRALEGRRVTDVSGRWSG